MALNYFEDKHLSFLPHCEEDDLRTLASYLMYDKDGNERNAEELSTDETYKKYRGHPEQCKKSWKSIAAELQYFGGDPIANGVRRHGVCYKEILCDVCDILKVKYGKDLDVPAIEINLLQKMVEDSWGKLSENDREEILSEIGINASLKGAIGLGALQTAIRFGGFQTYQLAVIIANAVSKQLLGHGLKFATNISLVHGMAIFAGPIGWILTTIISLPAITGPAFRVTIPAVIQVSYMRLKMLEKNHLK